MNEDAVRAQRSSLDLPKDNKIYFGDLLGNSVHVYLDEIIIASQNVHAHMDTLNAVLHKRKEVGLNLRRTKGELHKPRIKFLGHIVVEFGIHTSGRRNNSNCRVPSTNVYGHRTVFRGNGMLIQTFYIGLRRTCESP